MKNLRLLFLLTICIALTNCSDDENDTTTKTKEDLLVKKWNFNRFEFVSSSNNSTNISKEKIETAVKNQFLGKVTYEFFSNKTGKITLNGTITDFKWNLNNNSLFLDFDNNNRDTDYIINSISESKLNITFNHEAVYFIDDIEISIKGNYFYK